jgi:hypothetical protein
MHSLTTFTVAAVLLGSFVVKGQLLPGVETIVTVTREEMHPVMEVVFPSMAGIHSRCERTFMQRIEFA